MSDTAQQANSVTSESAVDRTIPLQLSEFEWSLEKCIDETQRNLASVEQSVSSQDGQILTIRKYQSQCRRLSRWIPIAFPTPEYLVYASDLKPEVERELKKIPLELRRLILHQAVLRLFEALGVEPYISIGRKLIVKFIED
jgi:hypothetical protein